MKNDCRHVKLKRASSGREEVEFCLLTTSIDSNQGGTLRITKPGATYTERIESDHWPDWTNFCQTIWHSTKHQKVA